MALLFGVASIAAAAVSTFESPSDELYMAASLPFIRIRQPRDGLRVAKEATFPLVGLSVYNLSPRMWAEASACVCTKFEARLGPAVAASAAPSYYHGCFGPAGAGVLVGWPEASFQHHAKVELTMLAKDAPPGTWEFTAYLVFGAAPPVDPQALGSLLPATGPLAEALTPGAFLASNAVRVETVTTAAPNNPNPAGSESSAAGGGPFRPVEQAAPLRVQERTAAEEGAARHWL
eukprot:CAMPEP_0172639804 /NCGR_PEP_ID=MMETSP1068-20121228/219960_1 /TAXON_ID=35684 /ORGANISM="Pseudopedinella elastica, Strain CCMP716" /LENGTH=232 /DNA_ID=CAMNT_0013453037 /DNA_START=168 /DNA_END=863 /DNA_ORIENTATION=+